MAVEKQAGPAAVVLAATAARRYYFDGASKSDIAGELGLSRFKVARLLDQALASGLVRIELHSPGTIDLDLSIALKTAYGLRHCVVIDSPEDDEALLDRPRGQCRSPTGRRCGAARGEHGAGQGGGDPEHARARAPAAASPGCRQCGGGRGGIDHGRTRRLEGVQPVWPGILELP